MENEGGSKEVIVGAPEMKREAVFDAAEMEMSNREQLGMSITPVGEKISAVLPPPVLTITSSAHDANTQDGDAPVVSKDAERMPKEYAKHLVEIMRKYKKEPNQLQRSVTNLKWDYMRKAFGRSLGDGLDGRAKG
jgi:hypothetical protein